MKMLVPVIVIALAGVGVAGAGLAGWTPWPSDSAPESTKTVLPLTIASSNGNHVFRVERAITPAEQEKGLMYRTDLTDDGGMLFWPYPPTGDPKVASFWMKNTPSSLDIIFIRKDGSIAHIAENTTPLSEEPVDSGEPVGAVLEIKGGRASALGISEGDKVSWPKS
jgi:uncharacterized membrane protein (UPF0127 family)